MLKTEWQRRTTKGECITSFIWRSISKDWTSAGDADNLGLEGNGVQPLLLQIWSVWYWSQASESVFCFHFNGSKLCWKGIPLHFTHNWWTAIWRRPVYQVCVCVCVCMLNMYDFMDTDPGKEIVLCCCLATSKWCMNVWWNMWGGKVQLSRSQTRPSKQGRLEWACGWG